MINNPTFGRWLSDDTYPDQCSKVENEHLTSSGLKSVPWDLRGNEKEPSPCTVIVGDYTIEDVVFPIRKVVVKRVRNMAEEAFQIHGVQEDILEYPAPPLSDELIPLYIYYLAKFVTAVKSTGNLSAPNSTTKPCAL